MFPTFTVIEIRSCVPARPERHGASTLTELLKGPWLVVGLVATASDGRTYSCEVSSMVHVQKVLIASRKTRKAARSIGVVGNSPISVLASEPGTAMLNAREIPTAFVDAIREAPTSVRSRIFRAELTEQELNEFSDLTARDDYVYLTRTMKALLSERLLQPRVDASNLTTALEVIRSTGYKTDPRLLVANEFFAPEIRDLVIWDLECAESSSWRID